MVKPWKAYQYDDDGKKCFNIKEYNIRLEMCEYIMKKFPEKDIDVLELV